MTARPSLALGAVTASARSGLYLCHLYVGSRALARSILRLPGLTLLDLLKQGKIKPLIAQRLPLEQARRAHELLGGGGVLGKIVLLPNG